MLRTLTGILEQKYNHAEASIMAREVLCHITGLPLSALLTMHDNNILDERRQEQLNILTDNLLDGMPLQYAIGSTTFCGHTFVCDRRALIPRPETEELVKMVITSHKAQRGISILDIGTGTGCIAISLALAMPEAEISALDISSDALALAAENAKHLNAHVRFFQTDILAATTLPDRYDIIVSNPPYIRQSEQRDMEANVLDHEPHTALFVTDADPLIFYRTIGFAGRKSLKENGMLYFEINQYLGSETASMLTSLGYDNVTLHKDINGNERMITAIL